MASAVDLCNVALSHIGADAIVTSISPPDGSVEAGHCARFFPIARRDLIDKCNFAFTKVRVSLAEVTNDSEVWGYAYATPSNMIRPLRVLQRKYLDALGFLYPINAFQNPDWRAIDDLFSERGSSDFELESTSTGALILRTNEPEAVLLYKRDVTDTSKFSPLFESALGMVLAGYVAGPIIKGVEGARIGADWMQRGYQLAETALVGDANGSVERAGHVAEHLRARS